MPFSYTIKHYTALGLINRLHSITEHSVSCNYGSAVDGLLARKDLDLPWWFGQARDSRKTALRDTVFNFLQHFLQSRLSHHMTLHALARSQRIQK